MYVYIYLFILWVCISVCPTKIKARHTLLTEM